VSTLKRYKDIEKSFAKRTTNAFGRFSTGAQGSLGRFFKAGRQKITIMLVPHTQKRILNVQLSFFGLAGVGLALVLILGAFAFTTATYASTANKLAGKSDNLSETQADLDSMRDQVTGLVKAAQSFQAVLGSTLEKLGKKPAASDSGSRNGDLASFFETTETGTGRIREAQEIDKVRSYLEQSKASIKELGDVLAANGAVLTEIPNIWPLRGAHVSMYYGQNENPIFGSWYLHKGIDLSTYRSGDPVLASADGKVVAIGYDIGNGNTITIEHKHGFLTRYCHLKAFAVSKGQKVQQSQTIGYVGNTGFSTGPHLHYEVHIATETVDPLRFLNVRSSASN